MPPEPPPSCTGDCVIQTVLTQGVCKTEFLAFDTCFDAAAASGGDDEACAPLFDAFRTCMKLHTKVNAVVKGAMG